MVCKPQSYLTRHSGVITNITHGYYKSFILCTVCSSDVSSRGLVGRLDRTDKSFANLTGDTLVNALTHLWLLDAPLRNLRLMSLRNRLNIVTCIVFHQKSINFLPGVTKHKSFSPKFPYHVTIPLNQKNKSKFTSRSH